MKPLEIAATNTSIMQLSSHSKAKPSQFSELIHQTSTQNASKVSNPASNIIHAACLPDPSLSLSCVIPNSPFKESICMLKEIKNSIE